MRRDRRFLKSVCIALSMAIVVISCSPSYARDNRRTADIKASIVCLTSMIAVSPRDPELYFERGLLFKKIRLYGAAADDLRKVQQLGYRNNKYDLYWIRGFCDYMAGDYYKAVEDYNFALKMDPKSDFCYANRACALMGIKRYKMALADCHKAIKLNSLNSAAFSAAGECYFRVGQYKNAVDYLNKAIQRNPNDAQSYYFRGAAYRKLGHKITGDLDIMKAKKLGFKLKQ